MQNKISERISYINWSESPMSSDVIIIKGDTCTWIYDVGNNEESLNEIASVEGKKAIILSHFHEDHTGNLGKVLSDESTLYVSRHTYRYTNTGITVDTVTEIEDGVRIRIIPLPSSHSKGCLIIEVDDEYAFLADAIYPPYKDEKKVYNVQLLKEQIEILNGLKASKFYLSHDNKPFVDKRIIVAFLKRIYEKRDKGSSTIEI